MSDNILEAKAVSKFFGGVKALYRVDVEIKRGEILGLMGPNGAGKTTFINVVTGYYRQDEGEIYFEDHEISKLPVHKRIELGLSRTFQTPRIFPSLTILDNVAISLLHITSINNARKKALELLEFVGLSDSAHETPLKLNLAMRKKLELARAIALEPKMVFVDEVAAGLNEAETMEISEMIKRINKEKGVTFLVVEHVIPFLVGLCQRIVVFDNGTKIAEGKPDEIIHDPRVVEAYIGKG